MTATDTPILGLADALPVLAAHGVVYEALGADEKTKKLIYRVGTVEYDKGGVIALARELAARGPVLSESLQERARRYVAARKRSGDALLEAVAELAAARQEADHGAWGIFLAAVGLDESRARAQIRIHEEAQRDPELAERIRSGWLSETVARELLPAPPDVRAEMLARDEAPTLQEVREAKRASTPVLEQPLDDTAAFDDARHRFAALGWKLERHGVWFKLSKPDGEHYATTQQLRPQIDTLVFFEENTVGQRAEPNQPDPKTPPLPAIDEQALAAQIRHDQQAQLDRIAALAAQQAAPTIPDDIRQAAGRLELLIEVRDTGVLLRWPEERTDLYDVQTYDQARTWLRDEAPQEALRHLDRTIPAELQQAGYFWYSADPPIIRHNDGWSGDAPTVDGALSLARDRLKGKVSPADDDDGSGIDWNALSRATYALGAVSTAAVAWVKWLEIGRLLAAAEPQTAAVHALRLIEQQIPKLPRTEFLEDLSRAIADLNECEEGSEWTHWANVGWALLDCEATP